MRIAKQYRIEAVMASQQDVADGDRLPGLDYLWAHDGTAYAGDGYVVAVVPCEGEGAVSDRALADARRAARGNKGALTVPAEQPYCEAPLMVEMVARHLARHRGRATVAINVDLLAAAATALGTRDLLLTIGGRRSAVLVEPWEVGVEPTAEPAPPFALVMPMLASPSWYRARRNGRRAREVTT